jgi:serine/threonine-protein kinase
MSNSASDVTAGFVPGDDSDNTRTAAPQPALTRSERLGEAAPSQGEASSARAIPGYEIERELGRGGMGVVYLARQLRLNRVVALKTILAGAHASGTDLARFLVEAEAAAAVQHPHVAQIYDVGTHDGQPYFALEYCPGGTLSAKLAGIPLPPAEAARLVQLVARAVQAAHDRGIIHRDLKPANVLLAADGAPKVADFGLARRTDLDSGLTATGAVLGSPSYMAPEQARGDAASVDARTDVYGLGAILYEALTGRPPFRAASVLETVAQVLNDDPPSPRVLVPGVPRDLETICLKCLQKDPARRYASAAALADDLQRWVDGVPVWARPVSVWERAWKAARRRPTAFATGLALLIGAAATVGIILWKNRDLERERDAARIAEADAIRERTRAHARLEKAVEAVERMVTRAESAEWSRNTALATERRRVLEDVVAFYERFGEADDPLVRRETARAYRRIGSVYTALAEYPKAADYLTRARQISERLVAEYPSEHGYAADLAEARLFASYVASSTGRNNDALVEIHAATALAREVLEAQPANDEVRRTLVGGLVAQGFQTMYTDRPASVSSFREALGHTNELLARPNPPFATRALSAFAHGGAALPDLIDGKVPESQAKIARASEIIASTPADPTAPARFRDLFDFTRGMIKMNDGLAQMWQQQIPGAAASFREAADILDELLVANPKAFQNQIYKFMILNLELDMLSRLKRTEELRRRRMEFIATGKAVLAISPNTSFIRQQLAYQWSFLLVERVKTGDVTRLDEEANEILLTLGTSSNGEDVRYNVACALSQGSRYGAPDLSEARAAKAVRLLTELLDSRFYQGPNGPEHIDVDSDLDPIRKRTDFQKFHHALSLPLAPAPRPVQK